MSARDQIEATVRAMVEALKAKDAAAAASFYTKDADVLPPDAETISGRRAIQEFWQSLIDGGLIYDKVHTIEVDDCGDSAAEVGTVTGSMPDESGRRTNFTAKYIVLWKRDLNGRWLLHRDIWNFNS